MTGPSRHTAAQAHACAEAAAGILRAVFVEREPADRALAAFLRSHRHFGARDRRLLGETLFAALRWWGWVRPLAPVPWPLDSFAAAAACPARTEAAVSPVQAWGPCLAAARAVDGLDMPPAACVWAEQAGVRPRTLPPLPGETAVAERVSRLQPFLGPRMLSLPRVADLSPGWIRGEVHGPDSFAELEEWLQRRPPVWLRVQDPDPRALLEDLRRAGLSPLPHPTRADAVALVPPSVNLRTLDAFRRGRFEVQDLASQMIGVVCDPRPGQQWWDACAGSGGKTLHLASLMARRGTVIASDTRTHILEELRRRARRAAFPNIRVRPWHGTPVSRLRERFDGVLIDAPCSCSGTWRRNPDGRWTLRPGDLPRFVELQTRLLVNASAAVRPGGVLVYATCSLFARENLGPVHAFQEALPGFLLDPFPHPLRRETSDGTLHIWPRDGDCDAMFVARFRRLP
ncbi:MAG: RsmB/NOP family class I SAM-dependent RNA methyltransferase [Lentisphaeria bacterium]|nr:RsmB/NOP family class I SAM-dependent RNA methyltransferase [Lentisphaeria bacterium]